MDIRPRWKTRFAARVVHAALAARDVARRFRFTAIQSAYGTRLAQAFGIDPNDPDTNAVIHGGVAYFKSDAALTVLGALPGWNWVRALRSVTSPAVAIEISSVSTPTPDLLTASAGPLADAIALATAASRPASSQGPR